MPAPPPRSGIPPILRRAAAAVERPSLPPTTADRPHVTDEIVPQTDPLSSPVKLSTRPKACDFDTPPAQAPRSAGGSQAGARQRLPYRHGGEVRPSSVDGPRLHQRQPTPSPDCSRQAAGAAVRGATPGCGARRKHLIGPRVLALRRRRGSRAGLVPGRLLQLVLHRQLLCRLLPADGPSPGPPPMAVSIH